jgi:hypothetical protein
VVQRTYELGGMLFGVRTNSEACGAWLSDVLARYEVADDDIEPYYSLHLAEPRQTVGKPFHILYREATALLRTFDLVELGRAFLSELETHRLRERTDALHVRAAVVSRDGVDALVPSDALPLFRSLGISCERELSMPVTASVTVDGAGRLAPTRATLDVPDDALERLAAFASANGRKAASRDDRPRSPGIFCTFHPALDQSDAPEIQPVSRGLALYNLARLTPNLGTIGSGALDSLGRLLGGVRCYQIRETTARATVGSLTSLLVSGGELASLA